MIHLHVYNSWSNKDIMYFDMHYLHAADRYKSGYAWYIVKANKSTRDYGFHRTSITTNRISFSANVNTTGYCKEVHSFYL